MFNIDGNNKVIHFIGIGGIGVSGLAEIMHAMGYSVQGSDQAQSQNTLRLEKLGIRVFIGHSAQNVVNAQVVVYSSAISMENPEILYAKNHQIPILPRSEMLSQIIRFKIDNSLRIARKTTVTSLCASILEMASLNPTVVNGGIINAYKTNAKLGSGDWAVVESDESDGSFVHLLPTIGIVTNIDHEHINYYGSFENLKIAFTSFIKRIPFYGCCVACFDDPNVAEIASQIFDRRVISYGISNAKVMYRAINISQESTCSRFDVLKTNGEEQIFENFSIPIFGRHNILNALAAIVTGIELGIDIDIIRKTLADFMGVNRRFTLVGTLKNIKFIDDYAHHPTEINSVLNAAKQVTDKKIILVCQPHRYTRLTNLFDEFVEVLSKPDMRIITSVYGVSAKEPGMRDSTELFESLRATQNTFYVNDQQDLANILRGLIDSGKISAGDIIIFAGAGSISKWSREIFAHLSSEML